jgi:hemolysin III
MLKHIYATRNDDVDSIPEEIVNGITHGIGALLSVAALTALCILAQLYGDSWQLISAIVFGISLTLLYLSSTLYHAIQHPKAKSVFHVIDHAMIYLLIAGTYTPFLLVPLRGTLGFTFFAIIWTLAVIGVMTKLFAFKKVKWLGVATYVAMGWLAVLFMRQLLAQVPTTAVIWLVAGGITYTLGCIFYMWRKLPFNHGIWHLFVLGGSLCHFVAVLHSMPGWF